MSSWREDAPTVVLGSLLLFACVLCLSMWAPDDAVAGPSMVETVRASERTSLRLLAQAQRVQRRNRIAAGEVDQLDHTNEEREYRVPDTSDHADTPSDVAAPAGGSEQLLVAVIATINPKYRSQWKQFRAAMRLPETKAAIQEGRVAVRYFVGQLNLPPAYREALKQLQSLHDDVVALDCGDGYNDLTDKTMAMIRYSAQHFPHVKLTWKVDLDQFVRIPVLLDRIQHWDSDCPAVPVQWMYWGSFAGGGYPIRGKKHKWYLSREAYSRSRLPYYLNGGDSYLLGSEAVRHIAALDVDVLRRQQKYLFLEDVSLGMWVQVVNSMLNSPKFPSERTAQLIGRGIDAKIDAELGRNAGPIVWRRFSSSDDLCHCKSTLKCVVFSPLMNSRLADCMFDNYDREKCCNVNRRQH